MKCVLIIVVIVIGSWVAFAQQQPTIPPPNGPLELPEFLVTGKELIDVGAGAKHAPVRPPLISASRMDSLNPTEKVTIPLLPARSLPQYHQTSAYWPGYVQAEIGNYITPNILAGYSLVAGGYRLDFSGDVQASDGWTENASYLTAGGNVLSTFIAPDKFVFFGGSTTRADIGVRHRSYRLFARPDAIERSNTSMKAGIDVDGKYDGISYQAQASWMHQSLTTASMRSVSDNVLRGALRIEQEWTNTKVGAFVDMHVQNYADNAYPFLETGASARWMNDVLRISAGAGVQWATSTLGTDRFGLAIRGQADIFIGHDLTVIATAASGMRSVTFRELMASNPYLDDSVNLDAAYDIIDIRGTAIYHPSVRTTISAGIRMRQTDREAVWVSARQGLFGVDYRTVSVIELNADARFIVSPRDVVIADIRLTNASVSGASVQPYVPGVRASADYERTLSDKFTAGVGMVYVGQRWADLANTISLAGYADMRLRASFSLSKSFELHARAENLLGSTVFVWENYRERGIFITAGCTWKF